MTLDSSIDQALRSPEPAHNLRLLVKELFSQGKPSAEVLALFEEARQALQEAGRQSDEEGVMDVMDCLVGWCSPHMKLEPEAVGKPQVNGQGDASKSALRTS
jgi:hypothetical protein